MNIHHLELFCFVAKHGGIAAAVRNIPYGIQQPAVSGQIAKLEESLGTKLFQRRPFALSPAGWNYSSLSSHFSTTSRSFSPKFLQQLRNVVVEYDRRFICTRRRVPKQRDYC